MRFSLAAVSSLFLGLCLSAHADTTTFNVNFTSADYSGTATLSGVTDPDTAGAYDITGGSILINGFSASLIPGGDTGDIQSRTVFDGTLNYDNAIYTNATSLDGAGLLFEVNGVYINIFYDSAVSGFSLIYASDSADGGKEAATFCADVAATPEPSSFALLGTGLAAAFITLQRRRHAV